MKLEATDDRDLQGRASGLSGVVITLGPRSGLEPRPDPGSYSPRALRPPPSPRPAARASSASHRPATRPSAVAPPRPSPSGCPAPTASPALPVACGSSRDGGAAGRTRPHLDGRCVCEREGIRLCPLAAPPRVPGAGSPTAVLPLSCGGREGRGWPGSSSRRARREVTPPTAGLRLEAAQGRPGTQWRDRRGAGRGAGSVRGCAGPDQTWAPVPAPPCL